MASLNEKIYLGDGVYAEHDGTNIWLFTLQGHRLALNQDNIPALLAWSKDLYEKHGAKSPFEPKST